MAYTDREEGPLGGLPLTLNDATDAAGPSWLAAERPRLVGFCAHVTGRPDAAEDLAQETLLEAWRNRGKLAPGASEDERARWLNAVARNVCLRWRRAQSRDAVLRPLSQAEGDDLPTLEESLASPVDLELELERDELVLLLDRALALLPAAARTLLLQRFVEELPHAEIAARLGVTEDVVAQRLRRGKLELRRLLMTDLRGEATSLGLDVPEASAWQETRIFCPFCGVNHLRRRIDRDSGEAQYQYQCAGACAFPSGMICGIRGVDDVTGGLASPKSILTRILAALGAHYSSILEGGDATLEGDAARCPACKRPLVLYREIPAEADVPQFVRDFHGLHLVCPACGPADSASLWHLALDHPAALAFWRAHPRMRALPITEVEAQGRPAHVTGFVSADGSRRLDIVSARDDLRVLGLHHMS